MTATDDQTENDTIRSRVRMELDQIIARLREAGWQKMAYNGRSITVKKR